MSPFLRQDDILSRMVAALKFTNLKSPDSVDKVLSIAGFSDDEIKSFGQRAARIETLRRTAMLTESMNLDNYEE